MSAPTLGTVAHTLLAMRGVWHDHVEIFDLTGQALDEDTLAGTFARPMSPSEDDHWLPKHFPDDSSMERSSSTAWVRMLPNILVRVLALEPCS